MSAPTPLERLACGEDITLEVEYEAPLYWLWLADLLHPGFAHARLVLNAYGGAKQVWQQRHDTERFAAAAGSSAARRLAENLHTPADFAPVLQCCEAKGIRVVTPDLPAYPVALSNLDDLPLVLYCTGEIRYLNTAFTVGMVGSRKPSPYGVEAAARLGKTIAQSGAVIVSGLADGLDSEGHKAAVASDAPTIAVLGVPIHRTYPAGNAALRRKIEQHGVVVSEYPPVESTTHGTAFLQRNRIIAGLSSALLVVEARQRSGTMSTVAHAERYGRPVYAVPGSIFSSLSQGTNELLESGRARPAMTGREILQAIGLPVQRQPICAEMGEEEPETTTLTPQQAAVLGCIGPTPKGLGALMGETGLTMGALLGTLTALEMAGRIVALPGRQYKLK